MREQVPGPPSNCTCAIEDKVEEDTAIIASSRDPKSFAKVAEEAWLEMHCARGYTYQYQCAVSKFQEAWAGIRESCVADGGG